MRNFEDLLKRKRAEHGDKFDSSDLLAAGQAIIDAYDGEYRIKVQSPWGEIMQGTIGVTTGWKPVFLLMHNSRAIGSSTTIRDGWKVLAIKRGSRYEVA